MPDITINIPLAADLTRVVDAICGTFGYQATITTNGTTTPNPETKNQFAKRMLAEWAKRVTRSWESQQAATSASTTADASSASITIN